MTLEITPFNGPATRVINLTGRTVTPGIIDAHNHMIYYGQQMKYQLDIRPPKVRTNKDLLRVVKEATRTKAEGEWIQGSQGFLGDIKDSLTRWELDEVSPKHPVCLPHFGGQYAVVNSLALKIAGVDKHTPQPYGGRIEKDEKTGEPTGRMIPYPAEDMVRGKIPRLSVEEYEEAIRHAANLFLPYGITSVQDVIVYMREHTTSSQINRLLGLTFATVGTSFQNTPAAEVSHPKCVNIRNVRPHTEAFDQCSTTWLSLPMRGLSAFGKSMGLK